MNRWLANGFALTVLLLFRTLRLRVIAQGKGTNPYEDSGGERFLYSVWHDSMVIAAFGGRHPNTTALTSQHGDGSFVAQVLRWKRVSVVRGSTSRISTGAIRKLMADAETRHLVITPDGPRGPNRRMSAGIAFLASRTGRAVIPTAYACSRCWRWRGSWSDLIIPKPFSEVVLLAGAPIYIEPGLSTDELRGRVAAIQAAMDQLDKVAESELSAAVSGARNRGQADDDRSAAYGCGDEG